jgi:hypothetical protein
MQQLKQQQTAAAAAATNDAVLLAARGDNRSERMQLVQTKPLTRKMVFYTSLL